MDDDLLNGKNDTNKSGTLHKTSSKDKNAEKEHKTFVKIDETIQQKESTMLTMKKSAGGVFGNITKEPPKINGPESIFNNSSANLKPVSGLFGKQADKDEKKSSSPSKKDTMNKNSSPIGFLAGSNDSASLFGNAKKPGQAPKEDPKGGLFSNT